MTGLAMTYEPMIFLKNYFINTTEGVDFLKITDDVNYAVRDAEAQDGLVTVIVPFAGAGLTIIEPLPEVIEGLKGALETLSSEETKAIDKLKKEVLVSPRIKSALLGRSLSIPIKEGKLLIDPYEEIFLVDFDKKVRRREFCVQVMHEPPAEEEKQR